MMRSKRQSYFFDFFKNKVFTEFILFYIMIEKEVNNMIEAIFLDRDGTIGGSNDIQYPGDFQLFPKQSKRLKT